jgi:uncharacterized protein (TIGR03067 family)
MNQVSLMGVFAVLVVHTVALGQTAESTAEIQKFQGAWRVVELVEDGQVIPDEAIKTTLPTGGRAQIVSNTFVFTSPLTKKKGAKVFSVDPTVYPKAIVVSSLNTPDGWGIYRFEGERLVICMSDPAVSPRPTDFSSRPGSKHMLMVLERDVTGGNSKPDPPTQLASQPLPSSVPAPDLVKVPTPNPPATPPAPTAATARVLTDAEVTTMLQGSWRLNDGAGVLQVNFDPNGSYRSYREIQNPNTFYKVFIETPVAAGTWKVQNGQLVFHITSSTDFNRVNRTFHAAIRSVSNTDFIFVDSVGRVGKAVKIR